MGSTHRKYEVFATVETMEGFEVLMRLVEDGEMVMMKSAKYPKRVGEDEMMKELKKFRDEVEKRLKPGEKAKKMLSISSSGEEVKA